MQSANHSEIISMSEGKLQVFTTWQTEKNELCKLHFCEELLFFCNGTGFYANFMHLLVIKKTINDKILMSTTQPFYNIQKFYEWILNRKWDWRKYITYINNIIHHSLILIGICFKKGIPHNLHSQIESFLYNCSSFELAALRHQIIIFIFSLYTNSCMLLYVSDYTKNTAMLWLIQRVQFLPIY